MKLFGHNLRDKSSNRKTILLQLRPIRIRNNQRLTAEIRSEDLGAKTIAGVNATGTRTTHIIPAGAEGNDEPITVTLELWSAPGIGVVSEIRSDPRTGTTTMELTEIQRGEPDPSLFAIPEGYTIKDHNLEQHN